MSFRVRTSTTGTVASVTLPGYWQPTIQITPTDLVYMASYGQVVRSGVTATDDAWHNVVVAHEYARGQTWFYVDGTLAGTAYEQLTPIGFTLGGPGSAATQPGSPAQADYQDWFIHRGMLDAEEVTAQYQGSLQQESLEIYSPLDYPSFPQGGTVTNRAQSLSFATINGATLTPPLIGRFHCQSDQWSGAPAGHVHRHVDGSDHQLVLGFRRQCAQPTRRPIQSSHTYSPGIYTVTLVASGAAGVSTNIMPNYIAVTPGPSTIAVDAGYLYDSLGNTAPSNSVAVLVVDTGTNGFVDLQPGFPLSLGATWGTEDTIVGLWDLSACACGNGVLSNQTLVSCTNGIAPGQALQLYWFPSLTLASNTLGITYYGTYTDTNSPPLDGSAAWVSPGCGLNVIVEFLDGVVRWVEPRSGGPGNKFDC